MRSLKRLPLEPLSLRPGGEGHEEFRAVEARYCAGEPEPRAAGKWRQADVIAALLAMQGNICVYCGSELRESDWTVEHFRPRRPYWFLAWTFNNLYLCCGLCQQKKGDHFPVSGPRADYEGHYRFCDEGAHYPCPDSEPIDEMIRLGPGGRLQGIGPRAAAFDALAERLQLNTDTTLLRQRIRRRTEVLDHLSDLDATGSSPKLTRQIRRLACRSSAHSIVALCVLKGLDQALTRRRTCHTELLPDETVELQCLLDELERCLVVHPEDSRGSKIICSAIAILWLISDETHRKFVEQAFDGKPHRETVWKAIDELSSISTADRRASPVSAGTDLERQLRDLEPQIQAAHTKLSTALGGRPTKQQIIRWLRQFRDPRWIELATTLLGHVRIFTRRQISGLIEDRLQSFASEGQNLYCPLGSLRDGASVLPYELGKVLKLGVGTTYLLDSAMAPPPFKPDRIWLLDDVIGEGYQAMKMLRGWSGASQDPKYPRLRDETLAILRSTPITIVAAVGLHRGKEAIGERAKNELGLDVKVELAKELDQHGCFDPEVLAHEEDRTEVRRMAETIGAQLVTQHAEKHGLSPEERQRDALGYFGGAAQLVVLETNPPTCSLPILWSSGTYDGERWQPLFPYRKTR